jgi:hypothetical protein
MDTPIHAIHGKIPWFPVEIFPVEPDKGVIAPDPRDPRDPRDRGSTNKSILVNLPNLQKTMENHHFQWVTPL